MCTHTRTWTGSAEATDSEESGLKTKIKNPPAKACLWIDLTLVTVFWRRCNDLQYDPDVFEREQHDPCGNVVVILPPFKDGNSSLLSCWERLLKDNTDTEKAQITGGQLDFLQTEHTHVSNTQIKKAAPRNLCCDLFQAHGSQGQSLSWHDRLVLPGF